MLSTPSYIGPNFPIPGEADGGLSEERANTHATAHQPN